MDVVTRLYHLGGVCDRKTLIALSSRREVDRALRGGRIVRDSRGRYSFPDGADDSRRAANALVGVVSHRSAAMWWHWEVKTVPRKPEVTIPRNRDKAREWQQPVQVHWGRLRADEIVDGVTSMIRTLQDCMRHLPFDEALAIADSALRHRSISKSGLAAAADALKGPGAPQARRVAREASGKPANPFESVLRAISLEVEGLRLEPQVLLARGPALCPDLVDERLRLVVEAESFQHHGGRWELRRDCKRYTRLTLLGWWLMRFSWEDVMSHPEYVRACLEEFVRAGRLPAVPVRLPVRRSA